MSDPMPLEDILFEVELGSVHKQNGSSGQEECQSLLQKQTQDVSTQGLTQHA